MDVYPGHRDDRDFLDFLPRHGREADPGSDPRRRREPRRGVPEDGDDALLRRHDEGRDPDRDAREGGLEALGGTPRQRPRHPSLRASEEGCEMTFLERTTDARRFRQWEGNVEADYIYTSGSRASDFLSPSGTTARCSPPAAPPAALITSRRASFARTASWSSPNSWTCCRRAASPPSRWLTWIDGGRRYPVPRSGPS